MIQIFSDAKLNFPISLQNQILFLIFKYFLFIEFLWAFLISSPLHVSCNDNNCNGPKMLFNYCFEVQIARRKND